MRIIALALAVLCCGCLTVRTDVGTDANGNPRMTQVVSGRAGAAVKAASQSLDGKITIDPDTGILTIEIISGQDAEGVDSDAEALLAVIRLLAP